MGWCATKDRFRFTPFSKLLNFPRDTHLAQDFMNLPNGRFLCEETRNQLGNCLTTSQENFTFYLNTWRVGGLQQSPHHHLSGSGNVIF